MKPTKPKEELNDEIGILKSLFKLPDQNQVSLLSGLLLVLCVCVCVFVNVEVMQLIQPLSRLARTGTNSKLLLHTLSPLPGHEHSQARSMGMPGAFN